MHVWMMARSVMHLSFITPREARLMDFCPDKGYVLTYPVSCLSRCG